MAQKLNEISTQYHSFVENQVLTESQLNGVISYFEDQDRLSRVILSGVGIVCGFKIKYNPSNPSVIISQGAGVTTDGDLLLLRENIPESALKSVDLKQIEYSWVRKFEDNFANYHFFKRFESEGDNLKEVPLDMWEILPQESENADPLGSLENLEDKVVVLYLESFAKEGDLCTAVDCDNQGVEQVARLRVLLVSKTDASYILGLDSIFSKHNIADSVFKLPDVAVRRVVLNPSNSADYNELKRAYFLALNKDDSLLSGLTKGIKTIAQKFEPILKMEISDNELNASLKKLQSILQFGAYNVPFNIQYRYDFIKDIVDTYNEIKSLLLSLKYECCPDINSFPKHLMLGSIDEADTKIKNYRHEFYKSPILNNENNKIEQCHSLVSRLFQMIAQFKTFVGETKITPSGKLSVLSRRAIPFYFNLNEKLLKNWNHLKAEKHKSDTNLSYHTNLLSEAPHIREPLLYNTDGFDFYRIEGHQGKNYKTVLEEIDKLKNSYGLAFDVKALSVNINRKNLNIDDYECEFEDLKVLLRAWTKEQECVLAEVSEFFSGFSMNEPGTNLKDISGVKAMSEARLGVDTFTSANTEKATREASKLEGTTQPKDTYYKAVYSKSNIVSDHLITDENALGSVMLPILEQYKDGSVNDLIVQAENLANQKIDTDAWSNQPEVKAFVIDQSIELMAYSHVLSRKMPGILVDVSDVNIANYKLTLKELCNRVDKMKTSYQNIELSAQLKAFMGVLITQLSSICCSAKKLEVLLEEIDQRKRNILLRLQLSKFVEKHPGLEHKAGVEPGGTFVLVYLNKSKPAEEEKATEDAEFEERLGTEKGMAAASETFGNRISRLEKYIDAAKSGMIAEENISKYEKQLKGELERMVSGALAADEISNNVVVADFSLPYMCCSDCAPVNFIIQKPPARLLLEKDEICLGKDSEIDFEVFPEDGIVEANREVPGMKIENKKLVFDANAFPEELLGETIRFTVNQQITDAELIVFKAPQVDFEAPERAAVNQRITFEPSGDIEGVSFLWDFGDGSPTSTQKSPSHRYQELPDNANNSVVVKLVVVSSNGVCSSTVEHEIRLFEIIIEVFLPEANYCEKDEKAYPFTVDAGANVKVEGPGVEHDENGNYIFIPAKAGIGEHSFKVNGKTADFSAKVHKAPVAKFTASQEGNQLVLTNNSTGADNYVWTINGKKQERADKSPVVINLDPNSPTAWRLSLEAISEFCGSDKQDLTAETHFIDDEPEEDICIDETGEIISNDLKILFKLNLPDSNFVVPVWMSTSQLYGGTAEFNKGVLDDLQNFLSGKNNAKLPELFTELLDSTAEMISRMAENPESEEYKRLLQIFVLQLQLFYNVLACQDKETIQASAEILTKLLDQIITILQKLKEQKVAIPESFSAFLKKWSAKIEGNTLLEEHWKIILENKLIS
ncbi:hypothetical protein SAMN05444280_10442 [Tangfeifania diversioriginum]|uniref:PKD domain-containing protein n=1 Tax=Tangfeifania diversioriginum TaxID=1168035 RepID=A0A1M6CP25_9BACT|nr:PKD domain-containing protein [Tangfeifania diversioriginum]SHI62757.1 hypothetical protein SAMN05444280_10442 [Tangfeifania diversioriginum]